MFLDRGVASHALLFREELDHPIPLAIVGDKLRARECQLDADDYALRRGPAVGDEYIVAVGGGNEVFRRRVPKANRRQKP